MRDFDRFWQLYPKKRSKKDARAAWVKLKPGEDLQAVMLQALAKQSVSRDWVKDSGKWVPYPASWLNGEMWEDEVESEPSSRHTNLRQLDHTAGLELQANGRYRIPRARA